MEDNFCEIICKIGEIYGIYGKLMRKKEILFQELKSNTIPQNLRGVYVIFDKNTNEALYVGRTKNLSNRLSQHLNGGKMAAPLKKYLIKDGLFDETLSEEELYKTAGEWMEENCYFRYIEINDSDERGHVEGLLGFVLNSKYIETEH